MAQFTSFSKKITLNCKGKLIDLRYPKVMGVLNITPDSFYKGSSITDVKNALKKAEGMLQHGAAFLDIGGYSSRPGADHISADQELQRVMPVVEAMAEKLPEAIISIDTFRAKVASEAIHAGASMVNDISGGQMDNKMFELIAEKNVPYILMHMQGTPQNMQQKTNYEDLLHEIIDYFQKRVNRLRTLGVKDIIVDVGFGFAKSIDQNYFLLGNLKIFDILKLPLLVGISRKSMVYKRLGITPEEAINGTTVLNTIALMNGANILRVHDVNEAVEAINLFKYTYP